MCDKLNQDWIILSSLSSLKSIIIDFYNHIATQLSLGSLGDPISDLIHFQVCWSAVNRTRDLLVSSQTRWPLSQGGSLRLQ